MTDRDRKIEKTKAVIAAMEAKVTNKVVSDPKLLDIPVLQAEVAIIDDIIANFDRRLDATLANVRANPDDPGALKAFEKDSESRCKLGIVRLSYKHFMKLKQDEIANAK